MIIPCISSAGDVEALLSLKECCMDLLPAMNTADEVQQYDAEYGNLAKVHCRASLLHLLSLVAVTPLLASCTEMSPYAI